MVQYCCVVVQYCGVVLWPSTVVWCCGPVLWCGVVVQYCSVVLWSSAVVLFYCPGPCFPKASLAYVVCEVRRTSIAQFSHRFPKASLVRNVVKTLIANVDSRGTRRVLRAPLAYYSLSRHTSGHSVYWMRFIKAHPIPRNVRLAQFPPNTPKTVVTADILIIDYC